MTSAIASSVHQAIDQARSAQSWWRNRSVRQRSSAIGRLPDQIARSQHDLLALSPRQNATRAEVLSSELFPLADACRYTAKIAKRALAPTQGSVRYGAWWMGGVGVRTSREPWGTVLILAPSNYPLYLPGVQLVQALAAGNAVILKPAPGCEAMLARFQKCLVQAGVPAELHPMIDSSVAAAQSAMAHGVDKVFLTGSAETGRAVLAELLPSMTPSTMELGGCDAVFVTENADLGRVARCVAFGLTLNGGATCIAPRRLFVTAGQTDRLIELLLKELHENPSQSFGVPASVCHRVVRCVTQALADGASLAFGEVPHEHAAQMPALVLRDVCPHMAIAREDLFGPVLSILTMDNMAAALEADGQCPYSLGASIFGSSQDAAYWATRVNAGCVVINDVIVPTADPRVAFGGRQHSGWGVTRGWEGLVEMTRPKTVCTRYGNWLPHLDRSNANNEQLIGNLLKLFHARGFSERTAAVANILFRRSQS